MKNPTNTPTRQLHALGQSLWVDNISRDMLATGTLARYIDDWSVTGLTSNPTIFEHAIGHGSRYDESIAKLAHRGAEGTFFALALEDLQAAADLFRPVFDATHGTDGWVSLEVSPLLVDDAAQTIQAAVLLHQAANRPNLFIKIPGTAAGYAELVKELGEPFAGRIEAPATRAQKKQLAALAPASIQASELAGETITAVLSQAPGNGAAIGGIKVM